MISQAKKLFLGPLGSYSHLASMAYLSSLEKDFGEKLIPNVLVPVGSFAEIFDCISKNPDLEAIIPMENSTAGDVNGTFEKLFSGKFRIVGERFLQIKHHILGKKGTKLDQIQRVYVHPQAGLQCSEFLANRSWQQIVVNSTSQSAEKVALEEDFQSVAIASQEAGEIYDLQILYPDIANEKQNYTRFLVIKSKLETDNISFYGLESADLKAGKKGRDLKYSLLVELKHTQGSLAKFLQSIAEINANLTKIESRPIANQPWNYIFYLDFLCSEDFEWDVLSGFCEKLTVLGVYFPGSSV